MNSMIKYLILLVLLFASCEDRLSGQNSPIKDTNTSTTSKHPHPMEEKPPLCENLSVTECLDAIIPYFYDRDVCQ